MSTDSGLNKLQYIHAMEQYDGVKNEHRKHLVTYRNVCNTLVNGK